jgi:mRNA interferase RelE/StbE
MQFSIEYRPSVFKSIKRFPLRDLRRIRNKIQQIAQELPDPGKTKMKGDNPFHKVITRNYRIIYEVQQHKLIILVIKIGHGKDVYNNL